MSYFSIALQRQAEQRHLNQSDLSRASGLSRSFISRVMSGESRDLSDQNVVAILKVFTADPLAQADLVAARCLDARQVAVAAGIPGASQVEIKVKMERREHDAVSGSVSPQLLLAQETERAFAWLRSQCPLNPDLERHLVGYARLLGMK